MRVNLRLVCTMLAALSAPCARAYEYPLLYTPPGDAIDLAIAGYSVSSKNVTGNCSYTAVYSGSGRDPRTTYVPMPQTCTWDLYGNIVSTVAGAPVTPPVIKISGSETVYGTKGTKLYTGTDSALPQGGFVFNYGAHYTWLTPNTYQVVSSTPFVENIVLQSDGDTALSISKVTATNTLKAIPDQSPGAKVTITANTCLGLIAPGSQCTVTISYSDTGVNTPSGLAYDTITVHLTTKPGYSLNFVQGFTDEVAVTPNN